MVNPFVWVVVGSALLSSFFSLAGYSLRAGRRAQLEEAFGRRAGGLAMLDRHMSALRLTTGFCRTIANLVMVLSLAAILDADGDWLLILASLAIAAAIIAVMGLAIPQAWAQHKGEAVLATTFPVLMLFRYLLYPVVATMQAFEAPVRRLAGADGDRNPEELARQEIIQAATEAQAEGGVEPEEAAMIASVVEFGDTEVDKIMTPRTDVFAISVRTSWEDACRRVVEGGHSRVPVYQDDLDDVIGVLYAKDLLRHVGAQAPTDISSVMRKAYFVPQTKRLGDLLREFRTRQVHIAVVLDEFGGTAGVVSIEDVLEEIVGEISDEYDRAEPALMRRIDTNSAEVDGRLAVGDLNEAMGLQVPQDRDYTTVAGMAFSELGYVPKAGETLEAFGAKFTVLAADERKITRLKVERTTPTAT